jgi:hypothetical protein
MHMAEIFSKLEASFVTSPVNQKRRIVFWFKAYINDKQNVA